MNSRRQSSSVIESVIRNDQLSSWIDRDKLPTPLPLSLQMFATQFRERTQSYEVMSEKCILSSKHRKSVAFSVGDGSIESDDFMKICPTRLNQSFARQEGDWKSESMDVGTLKTKPAQIKMTSDSRSFSDGNCASLGEGKKKLDKLEDLNAGFDKVCKKSGLA